MSTFDADRPSTQLQAIRTAQVDCRIPPQYIDYSYRIAGLKLNLAILHLRRSFRLVRVAVIVDSEEDLLHSGGQFALLAETVSVGEV